MAIRMASRAHTYPSGFDVPVGMSKAATCGDWPGPHLGSPDPLNGPGGQRGRPEPVRRLRAAGLLPAPARLGNRRNGARDRGQDCCVPAGVRVSATWLPRQAGQGVLRHQGPRQRQRRLRRGPPLDREAEEPGASIWMTLGLCRPEPYPVLDSRLPRSPAPHNRMSFRVTPPRLRVAALRRPARGADCRVTLALPGSATLTTSHNRGVCRASPGAGPRSPRAPAGHPRFSRLSEGATASRHSARARAEPASARQLLDQSRSRSWPVVSRQSLRLARSVPLGTPCCNGRERWSPGRRDA